MAVSGATCTLTPNDPSSIEEERKGITPSDGTWVVRGMAEGQYTASAKLPDGKTVTAAVTITPGAMTTLSSKP